MLRDEKLYHLNTSATLSLICSCETIYLSPSLKFDFQDLNFQDHHLLIVVT
jgi:hypothetical protein